MTTSAHLAYQIGLAKLADAHRATALGTSRSRG
jgi:hypothetical protein